MSKKIVGVDFDDVLFDTWEHMFKYYEGEINGAKVSIDDITDYDLTNVEKFGFKSLDEAIEFIDDFIVNSKIEHTSKVDYSHNKLIELKNAGYDIVLVTGRKDLHKKQTLDFLRHHDLYDIFSDIVFAQHFTDNHISKADICKDMGIKFMIDDHHKNLLELLEVGVYSYLMNKPWNKSIQINSSLIKRIHSWKDVDVEYIGMIYNK